MFPKYRIGAIAPNAEGGDPSSVPGGVGGDPPATPATPDPWKALADSVGWRNPDEIKAAMKSHRDQVKALEAQGKQLQALLPVVQQLQKLMPKEEGEPAKAAETSAKTPPDIRDLRLAFLELDNPIPKDKRALIERLYKSESPENVETWLADTVAMFGLDKKPDPKTETQKVSPAPVAPDTGPAGLDRKNHLPDDILQVDGAVFRAMSPQEKDAYVQRYKRSRGMDVNVFAEKRSKPLIPIK